MLEVKRLKTTLAARAGQEDVLSFLLTNPDENVTFVQDLQAKLKSVAQVPIRASLTHQTCSSAQAKADAAEVTIASLDRTHPDLAAHLRAETQAREQCTELRCRLEQYERVFGASLSGDAAALAEQLREKDALIRSLQLLQKQEAAAVSLFLSELVLLLSNTPSFLDVQ